MANKKSRSKSSAKVKEENKEFKKILIVIGVILLASIFLLFLSVSKTHDNGGLGSGGIETESPQDDVSVLQSKTWIWESTNYNDDSVNEPTTPGAFTATFAEEGTLGAETDCNNGTASYDVGEGNALGIGPMATTRKACVNDSNENDYFQELQEVNGFMIAENGNLILMLPFDSGSMIFK